MYSAYERGAMIELESMLLEHVQRLYPAHGLSPAKPLPPGSGVEAHTPDEVLRAFGIGFAPDDIFYIAAQKSPDDIYKTLGKCRFAASGAEELRLIDQAVQAQPRNGSLEPAAICVVPAAWEAGSLPGFPESRLSAMAKTVKALPALTIRGCFFRGDLSGLHGEVLGHYFRSCYESAKRISTLLPCKISWLGILGGWAAAERNAAGHPETFAALQRETEIIAAQNRSTFYARLIFT